MLQRQFQVEILNSTVLRKDHLLRTGGNGHEIELFSVARLVFVKLGVKPQLP